jgi:hypothetical protein
MAPDASVTARNYKESITELRPEARELLIEYAGISEDHMLSHVHQMV